MYESFFSKSANFSPHTVSQGAQRVSRSELILLSARTAFAASDHAIWCYGWWEHCEKKPAVVNLLVPLPAFGAESCHP
jgi:hypothetical protein